MVEVEGNEKQKEAENPFLFTSFAASSMCLEDPVEFQQRRVTRLHSPAVNVAFLHVLD